MTASAEECAVCHALLNDNGGCVAFSNQNLFAFLTAIPEGSACGTGCSLEGYGDYCESIVTEAPGDVQGVSCVNCHLSTTVYIFMHQFEDRCQHIMHLYVNIVSKSVYHDSNALFLGGVFKPCCHRSQKPQLKHR